MNEAEVASHARSREHARNAIRAANESNDVATATLAELHRQNDQMRETSAKLDKIGNDLDTSERLLRGMNSFFGRIKNTFSSAPPPRIRNDEEKDRSGDSGNAAAVAFKRAPPATAAAEAAAAVSSNSTNPFKPHAAASDALDNDLDELGGAIKQLRNKSLALGGAIDEADQLTDEVTAKVDIESARMRNQNKKINKLL